VAARPPPRAQRPLEVGGSQAVNLRTLALAIATEAEEGVRALRGGAVDRWLRRALGDSTTAVHLQELVARRAAEDAPEDPVADAGLVCRAVALLDPLAPVCWRGMNLFPDGLGGALAGQAGRDGERLLGEMVTAEAVGSWAAMRPERCDPVLLRVEAHQNRQLQRVRGIGGGTIRLRYGLNPLLPCRSPLLGTALVVRLGDLLPALEAMAADERGREGLPVDAEIGAFLAARSDTPLAGELGRLGEARTPDQAALVLLRLLAWLQDRQRLAALPNLAAWLGARLEKLLEGWNNRPLRARMTEALAVHVKAGSLPRLLDLLDDHVAQQRDAGEAAEAVRLIGRIEAEIAELQAAATGRAASAREVGYEVVLGVGMTALTLSLIATLVM
jgi:hypothetical protein